MQTRNRLTCPLPIEHKDWTNDGCVPSREVSCPTNLDMPLQQQQVQEQIEEEIQKTPEQIEESEQD
jgi:hypothetical protein